MNGEEEEELDMVDDETDEEELEEEEEDDDEEEEEQQGKAKLGRRAARRAAKAKARAISEEVEITEYTVCFPLILIASLLTKSPVFQDAKGSSKVDKTSDKMDVDPPVPEARTKLPGDGSNPLGVPADVSNSSHRYTDD